jgi:hypothetical protein
MLFSLLLGLMLIGSITTSTFFWSSPHNTKSNFFIKSMNSAAATVSSSNIAAAAQTDTYKPLAVTSDAKTSKSTSDLQQNTNQLRQLEQSLQEIKQKYENMVGNNNNNNNNSKQAKVPSSQATNNPFTGPAQSSSQPVSNQPSSTITTTPTSIGSPTATIPKLTTLIATDISYKGTVEIQTQPPITGHISMTATPNVKYTLTQADLNLLRNTGIPVFNFQVNRQMIDNRITVQIKFFIPYD